jgi:pilus assembly protein Flp/PilA
LARPLQLGKADANGSRRESPAGAGGLPGSRAGSSVRLLSPRIESQSMKNLFVRFVREESGQDLIEYSLLASIIAIGSILLMGSVSTAINGVFQDIIDAL